MKLRVLKPLLLIVCACVLVSPQNEAKVDPYKVGENLIFVGKYKPLGLSFTVGDFNFTVSKAPNGKDYFIRSEAKSRGTLVKLFSFSFLQRFDSTVDSEGLRVLKTTKRDKQGKRVRDSNAEFDYNENKVTWVETDPNDQTRPPKRVASTIGPDTQDIISAVYMLRQKPMAIGKRFVFKVSDSGLVYDVVVNVTGRERRKSILGKLWCWKLEPDIFGPGKFIDRKGSLTFWITDDPRRIPIYAKLKTRFGSVHIKLKKMNNLNANPTGKK